MDKFKLLSKQEIKEKAGADLLDNDNQANQPRRGMRSRGPAMSFNKPKKIRETVKRLLGYMGVYKVWVALTALFVILATSVNLAIPYLFSYAIDEFILPGLYGEILRIVVIILLIAVGNSFIRFLSRFIMVRISQRIIKKIRKDAFDSLMKAPISYYDEKGSGDIVSRMSNDVELINASLGQTVLEVINSTVVLIGSLVYMFILSWSLSIVVVLFVPLMILFTIFISKRTRKGFKEQQVHLASLNGIIEENINGLKTVKLYNQEKAFTKEFKHDNDKLREAGFKAQVYAGILWPFIHFMNNLIYLTVIAVGAILFLFAPGWLSVTIGQINGVSIYSRQFIMPISNLSQMFNALMQGIAGAERVFELIDTASEYEEDGKEHTEAFQGAITFENVDFSYDEGVPVLRDINFTADKGDVIAIVGPTGGGKTTTIKLINRFYDLDRGTIKIDGRDIKSVGKDALRKRIGIVLQDTKLFKGTVFENIHYGDFSASKEQVIEASKQANAHDFISKLPQGYDSMVQEGGENFSQGERQLISIARTVLSNPSLLILDEATSNVDTRTEAKIQESMEKLMKGRTSIVIAHRLQTIQKATKILVIHNGELIEHGTHQSLLDARGFYHKLYQAQFEA